MQSDPHDEPVTLGFAVDSDPWDLYRLSACFFPLGKVGGKPAWLDPVHLPRSEQLLCKVCSKPLCFLLQVYATSPDDAAHSFHRSLFLFLCRNPQCSRPNDASNLAVFRCCVPQVNPWYPEKEPLNAELVGPDELPPPPADAPSACRVCGCFASKRCAKCSIAWYCSREHQALDWSSGHRSSCGQPPLHCLDEPPNPANSFLFEEMGMEMDREQLPEELLKECDSEGEEEEEEEEESRGRRLEEYKQFVESRRIESAVEEEEDAVEEKKDVAFERFNRVLQENAEQILRYQRGGQPLLPSDAAPPLPEPPRCVCGAPRHFEMQLTPHLLSLLRVDAVGESIDWAAVYVFTCSANCAVEGYAREELFKHDFQ